METSVVIYSKDAFVKRHRCCWFNGKDIGATENQIIDHVVWRHCGKGEYTKWEDSNCSATTGSRTKFCLQDIIDICYYNGVEAKFISADTILLSTVNKDLGLQINAIVYNKDDKMFIEWVYSPFAMVYDEKVYTGTTNSNTHQITILDMIQVQNVFALSKD
jgi:hypothetical protein